MQISNHCLECRASAPLWSRLCSGVTQVSKRSRCRDTVFATILVAGACLASSDTSVLEAVKSRDTKALTSLIRQHADVNAAQPDGATALAWAAYLGSAEVAQLLLAAGAKVDTADEYGETPLTLACSNGDAVLVEALLKAGADAKAARWNGETALMIAASAGSADAVKLLIAHGAPVNAVE